MVATEKLETDFENTISDIVNFIGLRPLSAAALANKKRFCVTSKVRRTQQPSRSRSPSRPACHRWRAGTPPPRHHVDSSVRHLGAAPSLRLLPPSLRLAPTAPLTVPLTVAPAVPFHSQAGIMDEKREEKEKAGVIGKGVADAQGVAECNSLEEKTKGADGVTRYPIDTQTAELLKAYFQPTNQKLYKMLGRDMGW